MNWNLTGKTKQNKESKIVHCLLVVALYKSSLLGGLTIRPDLVRTALSFGLSRSGRSGLSGSGEAGSISGLTTSSAGLFVSVDTGCWK